uniref:Uncharacterized protein n=1 Tax=Nelumbo nucifera TaxID=4432 RepID=A0A822Y473_NELNU|nr:TPA_asm: hypothetical protein HUJ06_027313 [Nelumbo nucifera]
MKESLVDDHSWPWPGLSVSALSSGGVMCKKS